MDEIHSFDALFFCFIYYVILILSILPYSVGRIIGQAVLIESKTAFTGTSASLHTHYLQ
jgi:hypothetical protein